MVLRRGIRRVLAWSLIALYGAVMAPGQGLHALTACSHRAAEHGAPDAGPGGRAAPLPAGAHEGGSCPICTGLSQAQLPTPDPGPVLRSPPREDHLIDAPWIAVVRARTGGDPRAPPHPHHI